MSKKLNYFSYAGKFKQGRPMSKGDTSAFDEIVYILHGVSKGQESFIHIPRGFNNNYGVEYSVLDFTNASMSGVHVDPGILLDIIENLIDEPVEKIDEIGERFNKKIVVRESTSKYAFILSPEIFRVLGEDGYVKASPQNRQPELNATTHNFG